MVAEGSRDRRDVSAGSPGAQTVLEAARAHIDHFFIASSLMTPESRVRVFTAMVSSRQVAAYLQERNYDLAIVSDGSGNLRHILMEDLLDAEAEAVGKRTRPIRSDQKLLPQASVVDVVSRFEASDYQFVFDHGDRFEGLITYADLNKPPVHVLFFIAISRFEKLLREVAVRLYDGDAWLERLPEGSRREIGAVYVAERAKGVETSLLECTTITHLKEILKRDGQWILRMGYGSRDAFKRNFDRIIHWRNLIMHSRRMVRSKDDARRLFPLLQELGEHATKTEAWLDGTSPQQRSAEQPRLQG